MAERAGGAWRMAEVPDGPAAVAARLGGELAPGGPARAGTLDPGPLEQRDGLVALTALPPLGRLDAGELAALAELTGAHSGELRLAPRRTLTLTDLAPHDLPALRARLSELGLVTEPGSGWVGLSACAGLGACTKALVDVRALAAGRAAQRSAGDPTEHWAACERRCGEPASVGLAAFARPSGMAFERAGAPR
jgi:sulfite reductase beta subunit-like hemoprotein